MTATLIETQATFPTRDIERRRDVIRDEMREAGIELLIAYGSGLHSFVAMNPAWYVGGGRSDCPPWGLWGDPLDRDPEAVLTDVLKRYIFLPAAGDEYCVVLTPHGRGIDAEKTAARALRR